MLSFRKSTISTIALVTLAGLSAPLGASALRPTIATGGKKEANLPGSKPTSSPAKTPGRGNQGVQPSSVGPKQDVWVLEQQNGQIGKMTIYAAQDALRVRVGNTGGGVLAKAPDWKVVAFNINDKTVYETSYDQFIKQELPSLIATSDYFDGRKLKPEPVSYHGWSALQVTAPTPNGTVGMMMPTYSGVGNDKSASKSQSVTVITSKDSPVDPHAMAIIKAIFRLPKFGGFPLGVYFKHSDGTSGVTLRTYSMAKEKIATSFFTCSTKGFERVKTAETAILYGLFDSSFMETP